MTTISNTLYAAAAYTREHGWQRHDSNDTNGARDIGGALRAVNNDWSLEANMFLRDTLLGGSSLSRFCVEEITSTEEAVAFLEFGADIAAADGL
jgi:hypothetical protein